MAVITEDAVRRLATFRGEEAPVTSCYLDVDGRKLVRQQDLDSAVEALLRPVRAKLDGDSSVHHDLHKIAEYVRRGIERSRTRGLAIFSCSAHALWEVVHLPVPVRNKVIVDQRPAVGQLESVVQEYDRFGVLLVDRQRARMFVFELGELIDHSELFGESARDYDLRGLKERGDKAHHVEAMADTHLRRAADVAFQVFRDTGFERFTASAPEELRPQLRELLHPYLRERFCGRINVTPSSSDEEIRRAAIDVEERVEREKEAAQVARLREAAAAGRRGVTGLPGTLQALNERRIETLLVSDGFSAPGWRCGPCGYRAARGPGCPVCDVPMEEVDDIVEDSVEEAMVQRCQVEICVDNADLDVVGRIGAFLRY